MYQNITGNIATDFENIQNLLSEMDAVLDDIFKMAVNLEIAIEDTLSNSWIGIDAETCEFAVKSHLNKIQNCTKWSHSVNNTIKKHSKDLYERALKDQNAKEFS